jgi:glycolate oxidase FAD binding subunit
MTVAPKVAALRRELGAEMVVDEPASGFAIGGRAPELLLAPASRAEMEKAIVTAAGVGLAVAPLGGRTALGALAPPTRAFAGLLTRRLAGVVEHAAADMTVTVRAGTRVADLEQVLGSVGQRLPVDVPFPERATVGGMIAIAASGPLRLGHGTLRDYLIGITVIGADGRSIRAGGRVVKNVAGYDLMKLHAGARGTLGLVVEATFRLKPAPVHFAWVLAAGSPAIAEAVRRGLGDAQVPAVALELLTVRLVTAGKATAAGRDSLSPFVLAVGIEGVAAEMSWQEERVREVLAAAGAGRSAVIRDAPARDFLRKVVDFSSVEGAGLMIRGAVLPSRLPDLIEAWLTVEPEAVLAAAAGSGVVRLGLPSATPEAVAALRARAVDLGGNATVESMPVSYHGTVDPRGVAAPALAGRLKAAFDPHGLFLPGSYLGLGAGSPARAGAAS